MSKGFLKFKDFKKFIDKYHYFLEEILLSNYGEIFLNKEIFKIIRYAKEKKRKISADTNLNYFNEKMAKELVKSKMNKLIISIDGATNKSYVKYRVGGNFNNIILNIKRINKFKKKYNSKYPELIWKFVLFNHNKHEVDKAKKIAERLNMKFRLAENWNPSYSRISEKDKKIITDKEPITGNLPNDKKNYCYQLWEFPTINYNGNLLGCCVPFQEDYNFGNVFEKGFFKAYNCKKIREARKIILKNKSKNNGMLNSLKERINRKVGRIGIFLNKTNKNLYDKIKKTINPNDHLLNLNTIDNNPFCLRCNLRKNFKKNNFSDLKSLIYKIYTKLFINNKIFRRKSINEKFKE
jgi:MoaA/NifB/PqqE/SkfB family radical SAM enzyme